jgi:hypothetical protein
MLSFLLLLCLLIVSRRECMMHPLDIDAPMLRFVCLLSSFTFGAGLADSQRKERLLT